MIDPLWTQTIAYEVNTACSAMQRIASAWRDNPKRDPMRVVETARSVARTLVALADQIEAKRNAALRLDEDVPA